MAFIKFLFWFTIFLFGGISFVAYMKKPAKPPVEMAPAVVRDIVIEEEIVEKPSLKAADQPIAANQAPLPEADRIQEFFNIAPPQVPFVETIIYKSRVPWLPGKSAWLSDYASHFKTSRHFIARSRNGKPDYFKQDLYPGDRFTVLKKDVKFRLVIDLSRLKMWFYAGLPDSNGEIAYELIKTYPVGLGRLDENKPSGSLTPTGQYLLGDNIAVYHPDSKGLYNGKKIDMIQVFGTRWIPFKKELADCSAAARGFGIHGLPWKKCDDGTLKEDKESLCTYSSDGCIRLATEDMEELFSIIITKETVVEIVKDYHSSFLAGKGGG